MVAITFGLSAYLSIIVSDVSAIEQYVKDGENGYIVSPITSEGMLLQLQRALQLSTEDYSNLLMHSQDFAKRFTFEHYTQRILSELLS